MKDVIVPRGSKRRRFAGNLILAFAWPALAQSVSQPVEPNAGQWKTGAISSGKDYRVPPPPDAAATRAEIDWLRDFAGQATPETARRSRPCPTEAKGVPGSNCCC